ncbi:PKD domain-containing protein, partial [Rhodoflexus caldus]
VSGPNTAAIATPANVQTLVSGLVQGTYVFRLTATDNAGATASADVNVTVNAAANRPPVANPGANQSITLPATQVVFDGRQSSDPDGSITSYRWEQVGIGNNSEAVLINFTGSSQQGLPWNNTPSATNSGAVINNLRTQGGQSSPINITLQSNWGGSNEFGSTANNTGVVPDNVMRSCFW